MEKLKFSTDGWRGIIARDFTLGNVVKIGYALARWLTGKYSAPYVVLGYDCRFGGEMFAEAIAKILASKNIRVYLAEGIVSTPMISLGVVKLKTSCGVMISASHYPAEYNGIQIKGEFGGPLLEKDMRDIENLSTSDYTFDLEMLNWNYFVEQGLIQYFNIESLYLKNIHDHFPIEIIKNSGLNFAFDAMYGSTQNVMLKLLPNAKFFHCQQNPSFNKISPDPLPKNLYEITEYINQFHTVDCALAVDGDGDRLALIDHLGGYYDSHRIMLLLVYYLAEYKGLRGKVVASLSSTSRLERLCAHYGIELVRTPIGFREITKIMLRENILVGGEENGGMALGTYLPDRDGFWIGLTIWQWLAESGKSLHQLMEEVYNKTGHFAFDRRDIELNKNHRSRILERLKNQPITEFGEFLVTHIDDKDGYKYFFGEDCWLLVRPSANEPMLRIYAEAENNQTVSALINRVMDLIYSI